VLRPFSLPFERDITISKAMCCSRKHFDPVSNLQMSDLNL